MIIGIDLATHNCGLCFLDDMPTFTTVGLKSKVTPTEDAIFKYADSLALLVKNKKIYVDFSWQEIFLPGRRSIASIKYFLAGAIYNSAGQCSFISPKQVRDFFNLPPKTKKEELHKLILQIYPENLSRNEHELDALILAHIGKEE